MKQLIKKLPIIGSLAIHLYRKWQDQNRAFPGSQAYWENRYHHGGNSGGGSYDKLAEFKAEILNAFVRDRQISAVIEYGCGDGNQLRLATYPFYLGVDVSQTAIVKCRKIFDADPTKQFKHADDYAGETAPLTLSLDVIYHLVEDDVYHAYMARLFDSSNGYVAIYASNTEEQFKDQSPHVRHRRFSAWIEQHRPGWRLVKHIPNRYPLSPETPEGSFADFYFYEKQDR